MIKKNPFSIENLKLEFSEAPFGACLVHNFVYGWGVVDHIEGAIVPIDWFIQKYGDECIHRFNGKLKIWVRWH